MKKTLFIIYVAFMLFTICKSVMISADVQKNDNLIIRKIPIVHCMRGTQYCAKCREFYKERYCLLDISVKDESARPVIEVERDGKKIMCEYNIVKIFDDLDEAKKFAKKNNISDIKTLYESKAQTDTKK